MNITTRDFLENKGIITVLSLFIILTAWRIALFFVPQVEGSFNPWSFAWGASYQIIAIWGAVWGIRNAKSWGGFSSLLGRAMLVFSVGLLFQSFGQTVYSYYIFKTGEALYPSIGDIGFFGSIPFYIYGVLLIGRISRVSMSLKSLAHKTMAFIIPLGMVAASYIIFLSGHQYTWDNPLSIFLDLGYPIGQAIYVGIAILILLLIYTKNYLGGIIKNSILLFLAALVMQYISDFTFLYQASRNIYIPEGVNDLMYMVSYLLMALSLIRLQIVFNKIKES